MSRPFRTLVVGATGSIGRHVVAQANAAGHDVRALVRDIRKAKVFLAGIELAIGDLTEPARLVGAVTGVDGIVFVHGSDGLGKDGARAIDYGGVRNVLEALGRSRPRIALMTAIGVTERNGPYNRSTEAHDWKRRAERLVRASGLDYTIVRPGWFDCNASDQLAIRMLQGDRRHAGTPEDGVIARAQIARVLVESLSSAQALRKSFELVAEKGPDPVDLGSLFEALVPDDPNAPDLDAPGNFHNMPIADEPQAVLDDLASVKGSARGA